ncbi:MAG TPA: hypothetical protein VGF86_13720 [Candidatus Tumulicola sp.]
MNPEKLAAAVMLISLTFGAGLQVDWGNFLAILKNVSLLARALIVNFAIVPLFGIIIARGFGLPDHVATGFLLMAIAPGVPFILMSVRKKGGRLSLAIALAVLLPLISIVTVPLMAQFVLPSKAAADLPIQQFVVTLLLFQLLPLLLGMLVGVQLPSIARRLAPIFQILFFASLIALVAILAPKLGPSITVIYGSKGMLAMLCLVLLSLGSGWLLGGPAREDRRVLGTGTALRNIGLCALVAATSFKDQRVTAAVLVYFLIQFLVTTIAGAYFKRTAETTAS